MKQVVITADSAADLPKETAEKYGIEIMPMYVIFGGDAKKDSVEISAHEIFDYVEKTGEIPKTSAVSVGEYIDFFSKFTEKGLAVVHLSFCSSLSSTHRNAKLAASGLDGVYVLDTLSLGGGISLLALKGCEMREAGVSAEEIYSELQSLIPSCRVSYLLDSIEFLRRSGRCSAAASFGANLLSIKPCAAMIDGKIEVIKKYRGKGQAVRLQYAAEQLDKFKNIDFGTAFVYHSGVAEAELNAVESMLKKAGFRQIITAFTGCMISLHSAKGALGIHFIAD